MVEEGKTVFYDGMRVSREHLEHLQDLLHQALRELRATIGKGKVAYGFQVTQEAGQTVKIAPGLAFDRLGRRLALAEPRFADVLFASGQTQKHIVLRYQKSEASLPNDTIPTIITDGVTILVSDSPGDPAAGDLPIATITPGEGNALAIRQEGSSYLVPAYHTHSGNFFTDDEGFQRYDGPVIVSSRAAPLPVEAGITVLQDWFDSGFVSGDDNKEIAVVHNLGTTALFVEVLQRSETQPNANCAGIGNRQTGYWYELPDANSIVVRHNIKGNAAKGLAFRVLVRKAHTA